MQIGSWLLTVQCVTTINVTIFSNTINWINKCQTLHGGTSHWALPVHSILNDLSYISESQHSYIFNIQFHVLIQGSWNYLGLLIMLVRSWICHHFLLARKKVSLHNNHCYTGMLSDLMCQKLYFCRCYKHNKCHILYEGTTQWALPMNTTFSDLEYIYFKAISVHQFNWKFCILIWFYSYYFLLPVSLLLYVI